MDGFDLPDKKIIITMFLIGIFSIIAFILLVISIVSGTSFVPGGNNSPSPSPALNSSTTEALETEYSQINKITPGKTNFAEAQKINGKANEIKRTTDKTYLFYKTPVESHQNVILVKNNLVVYSTENVYGNYRKTVSEFKSEYGKPNMTLFELNDGYPWDIFLTKGVGIKSDGKDVGEILYFAPQNQQSFMVNIAPELNLSTTPSAEAN